MCIRDRTLYINFQEDFIKCAFFKELVLKLKNMIYYFKCVAYFLRYRTCCFRNLTNFSKKKRFYVIKRRKSFKFQIGGLTYQIKIYIYDNYVCSQLNFFYFRNLPNFYILYSLCSLMDKASTF